MENWANRRIAVIESQTNIAVAYEGTKAAIGVVLRLESGPAVIKPNTTNMPSTTASANRFCAGPGDSVERMISCSSETMAAVFSIGAGLRSTSTARLARIIRL